MLYRLVCGLGLSISFALSLSLTHTHTLCLYLSIYLSRDISRRLWPDGNGSVAPFSKVLYLLVERLIANEAIDEADRTAIESIRDEVRWTVATRIMQQAVRKWLGKRGSHAMPSTYWWCYLCAVIGVAL
jgi:hypothetical protein